MQTAAIRRRTASTVSVDRYRARALSERATVRTNFFKRLSTLIRPAIAIVALAVAVFAMPGRHGPSDGATMTSIAAVHLPAASSTR